MRAQGIGGQQARGERLEDLIVGEAEEQNNLADHWQEVLAQNRAVEYLESLTDEDQYEDYEKDLADARAEREKLEHEHEAIKDRLRAIEERKTLALNARHYQERTAQLDRVHREILAVDESLAAKADFDAEVTAEFIPEALEEETRREQAITPEMRAEEQRQENQAITDLTGALFVNDSRAEGLEAVPPAESPEHPQTLRGKLLRELCATFFVEECRARGIDKIHGEGKRKALLALQYNIADGLKNKIDAKITPPADKRSEYYAGALLRALALREGDMPQILRLMRLAGGGDEQDVRIRRGRTGTPDQMEVVRKNNEAYKTVLERHLGVFNLIRAHTLGMTVQKDKLIPRGKFDNWQELDDVAMAPGGFFYDSGGAIISRGDPAFAAKAREEFGENLKLAQTIEQDMTRAERETIARELPGLEERLRMINDILRRREQASGILREQDSELLERQVTQLQLPLRTATESLAKLPKPVKVPLFGITLTPKRATETETAQSRVDAIQRQIDALTTGLARIRQARAELERTYAEERTMSGRPAGPTFLQYEKSDLEARITRFQARLRELTAA